MPLHVPGRARVGSAVLVGVPWGSWPQGPPGISLKGALDTKGRQVAGLEGTHRHVARGVGHPPCRARWEPRVPGQESGSC